MAGFDEARFALEAATGGNNTLLLDDLGLPSVMVRIPMFRWSDVIPGGEDAPCSAFVVGGRVLDCIYISKYQNIVERGRAYSLPNRDPAHTLTIDQAREVCAAKGRGWHLMTNAEWAAIAHWCVKNGTIPRGNTNFSRSHSDIHEHGVLVKSGNNGEGMENEMRTLTGSGRQTWTHDGTWAGICDLSGNIWDFVAGLRIVDGEIQVIPDNDSALNADESAASGRWRAIGKNGALVMPGSPGTYKYDGAAPGISSPENRAVGDGFRLDVDVRNPNYAGGERDTAHRAYGFMPFFAMTAAENAAPHTRLVQLGLFPRGDYRDGGFFFLRNYGERMAARGGSWFDGDGGGLWDLYLRETREFIFPDIGFRAAWADVRG
ncbi:MAG: SUMF1/EgtB/PvdO family nonheme iron enzyme [Oscillospiraceae bacterium]|jgi:hypothetical protein|nr:SUMF1/EgtB/PvdO family nonheme iron enzyme [Oscillospiraceae bacterium]